MREIITKVYKFNELSDEAKAKAIENYREHFDFYYDCVIEDAKEIGHLFGIEIDKVYFSGFCSQGDGASFTGTYRYKKGGFEAVKNYANDSELLEIVKLIQDVNRKAFYRLSGELTTRGIYSHSGTMAFTPFNDVNIELEKDIQQAMRYYADWIYKQLESEYDYQMSDESITESIICNEYEFTVEGEMV